MKRRVVHRPVVTDALVVLGQLVRQARATRGWTAEELARRADVSPATISKIEAGAAGTAVGTVFNVADLVGVPIFGIGDRAELARRRRLGEETLALLPARVYHPRTSEPDDDF
ncbi:helix-turn-helix transcriptional regulator [Nocardia sp. NPDC059177]|uniref:helix-turn-helix transcriptional regulator n=1 Tax=Nocardia sp. NPDC059177 TaxID=3346759 RepID=UPI00367992B3